MQFDRFVGFFICIIGPWGDELSQNFSDAADSGFQGRIRLFTAYTIDQIGNNVFLCIGAYLHIDAPVSQQFYTAFQNRYE